MGLTKKTRKKKTPIKVLNDSLDNLWSELVKIIGGYECAYCGKTSYLNSHHLFSRNNFAVRWDTTNGMCLCSGCHTLSSKFSAHKTPIEFVEWLKVKIGEEAYDKLRLKANATVHWMPFEKEELLEKLKQKKKELL